MGFTLQTVGSHLLTSLQFILYLSFLLRSVILSSQWIWSLFCVVIFVFYSLMRNDNMITISCAHLTFIYFLLLFIDLSLPMMALTTNQWEQNGSFNHSLWTFLTHRHTYSNFRAVLVIWLKPSSESHGLRLTWSLTSVYQTGWLLYFSISLMAQDLIWMLHYKSKIDLTDLLYNTLSRSSSKPMLLRWVESFAIFCSSLLAKRLEC